MQTSLTIDPGTVIPFSTSVGTSSGVQRADEEPEVLPSPVDERDVADRECRLPKNRRSTLSNRAFKAHIHHNAEVYDNVGFAYVFDVAGCFYSEEEIIDAGKNDAHAKRIADGQRAFLSMSFEEQVVWMQKVAKYPSLRLLFEDWRSGTLHWEFRKRRWRDFMQVFARRPWCRRRRE